MSYNMIFLATLLVSSWASHATQHTKLIRVDASGHSIHEHSQDRKSAIVIASDGTEQMMDHGDGSADWKFVDHDKDEDEQPYLPYSAMASPVRYVQMAPAMPPPAQMMMPPAPLAAEAVSPPVAQPVVFTAPQQPLAQPAAVAPVAPQAMQVPPQVVQPQVAVPNAAPPQPVPQPVGVAPQAVPQQPLPGAPVAPQYPPQPAAPLAPQYPQQPAVPLAPQYYYPQPAAPQYPVQPAAPAQPAAPVAPQAQVPGAPQAQAVAAQPYVPQPPIAAQAAPALPPVAAQPAPAVPPEQPAQPATPTSPPKEGAEADADTLRADARRHTFLIFLICSVNVAILLYFLRKHMIAPKALSGLAALLEQKKNNGINGPSTPGLDQQSKFKRPVAAAARPNLAARNLAYDDSSSSSSEESEQQGQPSRYNKKVEKTVNTGAPAVVENDPAAYY